MDVIQSPIGTHHAFYRMSRKFMHCLNGKLLKTSKPKKGRNARKTDRLRRAFVKYFKFFDAIESEQVSLYPSQTSLMTLRRFRDKRLGWIR